MRTVTNGLCAHKFPISGQTGNELRWNEYVKSAFRASADWSSAWRCVTKRSQSPPLGPFGLLWSCSGLSLPDLVGHPLAEIAVFGLGLFRLHKRDVGSAERRSVAIEYGEVHQALVET